MRQRILLASLALTIILGITGCPGTTSIADINKDPGRFAGKEITIAGHTTNAFGALGNGVFEVDDGSGKMWVYSSSFGVPSDGTKVAVTGTLQQGVAVGGRSFAVILKQTKARH